MRLFRRRSKSPPQYAILPLNDPRLPEHARRLADFAAMHSGEGHRLVRVRSRNRGQTIVCRCSVAVSNEAQRDGLPALMEDEAIDDDGDG